MNEIDYFAKDKWHPDSHKPTEFQKYAWQQMKRSILNPIRRYVSMPVNLSNVIRIASDYDRLRRLGYNPSPTSDHFAGQDIPMPGAAMFTESTFAADFVFAGDMKGLCRDIYRQANNEIFPNIPGLDCDAIGQLILEGQMINGKLVTWVHVSLATHVLYSPGLAAHLDTIRKKQKWLEYKTGTFVTTRFE